jgi:glycosyltransferase involved in cell wall biosynthesis
VTRSLSVLLLVHNVQSSLSRSVHEILDVMAELTCHFELVIIDESSTDGTWDVARELAQLYPQVRLLRHVAESLQSHVVESLRSKIRRGEDSNRVRRGGRDHVRVAQGDVVIAHDGQSSMDAQEIARLWRSLSATPAPKFLNTPGASSAARPRESGNARSQGFRVLRSSATEAPRRWFAASGVR